MTISLNELIETLLDLLDLYTHHRSSTIVGQDHTIETFIGIRIALNQEASAKQIPRHTRNGPTATVNGGKTANGTKEVRAKSVIEPQTASKELPLYGASSIAPSTPSVSKPGLREGTVRFMLDPQRAKEEKDTVSEFFNLDEEEYEIELPAERSTERERRRP